MSALERRMGRFGVVPGAWWLLLGSLQACQPVDTWAALGQPFSGEGQDSTTGLASSELERSGTGHRATACEVTERQALDILDRTCARCHGGDTPGARQGTPPFDCVLDTDRLITMTSATAKDPRTGQPARFLIPGDADHSRIYLRPLNGEMPPPDVIGLAPNPRPSVSDLSVLRHWIQSCIETSDNRAEAPDTHETHELDLHAG